MTTEPADNLNNVEVSSAADEAPRRRGAARSLLGWVAVAAGAVAAVSLALVAWSVAVIPDDVCGPYSATWNWSFIPLGVTCDFSADQDWTGPVRDFREFNTPALITLLISTLFLIGALCAWIATRATRLETRAAKQ